MNLQGVIKPMPGYHVHYRADIEIPQKGRDFVVDADAKKDFALDEDGTLRMSPKGYEYMREANGTHVVIEPRGGMADSATVAEELHHLRDENERLKLRQASMEQQYDGAYGELSEHAKQLQAALERTEQELQRAQARVAELEAAAASGGKKK